MISRNESIDSRMFETIFEDSHDPIYVIDSHGEIIKVNHACSRFCGYPKNEIVGKNLHGLEGTNFLYSNTVREALKSGKRVSNWEKTDSHRDMMITAIPVFGDGNRVERIICTIKDITELSKLKMKIKEVNTTIKQYETRMNTAIAKNDQPIILRSKEIKKAFDIGKKVANVNSTVFILGESGVGKNVLARMIHEHSLRKRGPYIEINCGAISETLLESELFGYEGGAFTGAKKEGKKGHIEMAHSGTIFLDEIGEMTNALQVKLLHFLQSKTITKVGSSTPLKVDVRVIAATNQNIEQMVQKGSFRKDLFYRLNVIPIKLPPLRERKADILPLVIHFLNVYKHQYNLEKELMPEVIDKLLHYSWPGNVRELQNVVERLVVLSENSNIHIDDLPEELLKDEKSLYVEEDLEAHKIITFYNRYKSTYKAAEALGMSQSTFFRKLRRYKGSR